MKCDYITDDDDAGCWCDADLGVADGADFHQDDDVDANSAMSENGGRS